MPKVLDFDAALKLLFQEDRPTILRRLSRGVAIREFLNLELPAVRQRRVDVVCALADGSLLHIEFQSTRDPDMAYRMLEYYVLLRRKYRRPLRQVVLFVGSFRLSMSTGLEEENLRFRYEVLDIREIRVQELLNSDNHGNWALAVLAGDGKERWREILRRA